MMCRAVNGRHLKVEKSGSSHQASRLNEPFYHDGGYKMKKLVHEFIRKIFLYLYNEKINFIVFHVKNVNKSVP